MPLVSICIPTYNRAALLTRHLEHLARFKLDIEVVVSDNHSSDDTPAVASAFEKRFAALRYVRLPGRMHPHRCWDSALRSATGDYVYALGDDDLVVEAGLVELLGLMRGRPSVLAAFGAQQLHDLESGRMLGFTRRAETTELYGPADRLRFFSRHWTLEFPLMQREVYQRAVLFDPFHRFFLWSWVDAILRHGELVVTPVVMFEHHLHDKRLTHEQAVDTEWMFKVVSEIESFAATLDCDPATRAHLISWQLAQWYGFHAGLTGAGGNPCGVRLFIRKGMGHDPAAFLPLAREWERRFMMAALLDVVKARIEQWGGGKRVVLEDCDIAPWFSTRLAKAGFEVRVAAASALLAGDAAEDEYLLFKSLPEDPERSLRRYAIRISACMDVLGSLRLTNDELNLTV